VASGRRRGQCGRGSSTSTRCGTNRTPSGRSHPSMPPIGTSGAARLHRRPLRRSVRRLDHVRVGSMEEAERLVAADPFVREGLLENSVVKQRIPSDHSGDRSGGLCMAMIGGRRFGVP
jgi:hypothetical protein